MLIRHKNIEYIYSNTDWNLLLFSTIIIIITTLN